MNIVEKIGTWTGHRCRQVQRGRDLWWIRSVSSSSRPSGLHWKSLCSSPRSLQHRTPPVNVYLKTFDDDERQRWIQAQGRVTSFHSGDNGSLLALGLSKMFFFSGPNHAPRGFRILQFSGLRTCGKVGCLETNNWSQTPGVEHAIFTSCPSLPDQNLETAPGTAYLASVMVDEEDIVFTTHDGKVRTPQIPLPFRHQRRVRAFWKPGFLVQQSEQTHFLKMCPVRFLSEFSVA